MEFAVCCRASISTRVCISSSSCAACCFIASRDLPLGLWLIPSYGYIKASLIFSNNTAAMQHHSFPSSQSIVFDADSTLGALLIGVLLSYVLFGVTTTQVYLYSGRFPNDSRGMKLLVAGVWLLELGHVICIGHTLYVLVVSDFGHPERITDIPESLGVSTLLNAVIAMCVQGFFSYRIYRLWKRLAIPLLSWALSFLFLGATAAVFVIGFQASVTFQLFEVQWGWLLDSMWAVAAANDLIIAMALVFWLVREREDTYQITAVVDKVIGWTIETGLITSAAAILNLLCFVTMKNNFIWVSWYVVTARRECRYIRSSNLQLTTMIVYSNSFLASLNARGTLRTMTQHTISKPFPMYSSNLSVDEIVPDAFFPPMRSPMSEFSRHASSISGTVYRTV
ncbi:hypothetical protein C8R45DRAFT_1214296 [Mycena sanguinolenta]|nr:hypothetical protein C8R45DRAFT_1214296 [Mycena sanguinolenta]